MTAEGLLIKGYNGFYYVESENKIWSCSLRGRFRIKKQTFLPGDRVRFTEIDFPKGVIEEVYPRKNQLLRPPLANVDRVVITFAATNPKPDFLLLDRILLQVLSENITPILCFNKADLLSKEAADSIIEPYQKAGWKTVLVSAKTKSGLEELKQELKGHLVVMAGPSGAGKSSLLNSLNSNFSLETGELSKKVERGKHTTRRVELLKIADDAYIADTPGFSNLLLPEGLEKKDLTKFYPEFSLFEENCAFHSCMHYKERECGIKNAMETEKIDSGRYERYCTFLEELTEREGKY